MGAPEVPGLELSGLDFVSIAEGYGVPAQRVTTRQHFEKAYEDALRATGPVLIDVQVV